MPDLARSVLHWAALALSVVWLVGILRYFTSPAPWWLPLLAVATVVVAAADLALRLSPTPPPYRAYLDFSAFEEDAGEWLAAREALLQYVRDRAHDADVARALAWCFEHELARTFGDPLLPLSIEVNARP